MVSDWYETLFSWTPTLDHSMRMFISDHRDFSGDHRVAIDGLNIQTSNGSWRQGIKGEMTCTVYVALVWNIIYWIMMIITLFTE